MHGLIGTTLLNQYRVDAFVAAGGMGAVYRVWDLKRNVPLAMKVLHSELADDPHMFKRFQREANALKKLTHPHIVQFYGLFHTEDFAFLLERFVDGPSLKDILHQQKRLPVPETLVYLRALCAALGYAHASGVVHCDVKPGNVLIDRGGNVYLADFGIARHAESTTTTTGAAGTPAYMAPEQIRGEPVTPATDVYALGVMLFEMLTGQRPFRGTEAGTERGGKTPNERIRYAHLHVKPPDPRRWNPSIPSELAAVILRALSKSSAQRYRNAMEMLEAVQAGAGIKQAGAVDRVDISTYTTYVPSSSRGQTEVDQPRPTAVTVRPNLNNRGILFVGLFILIAGLGAFAMNGFGAPGLPTATISQDTAEAPTMSEPTEPPSLFTPELATGTTEPGSTLDESNNWIAYTYGANQDSTDVDPRYLAMINAQTGQEQRLTFDEGGVNFPSFSPHGDRIVYTGCKGGLCQLHILDVNTGEVEEISSIKMQAMWPDWCRDSSQDLIAFEGRSEGDRRIYVVDPSTGKVTPLTSGPFDIRPSWSYDCSRIVFLRDVNGQDDIYIYDFEEGREYLVLESSYDEFNVSWAPDGQRILFTRVSNDTNGDGFVNLDDRSDLFLIDPDGTGETSLSNGEYSVFSPSFSSDGKSIVFVAFYGSAQNQQIILYSLEDGTFTPLTGNGPYNHTDWSP
jgi:serine/threonine protein kinase